MSFKYTKSADIDYTKIIEALKKLPNDDKENIYNYMEYMIFQKENAKKENKASYLKLIK